MRIDLRYLIPFAAFWVPAILIRIMLWMWGVEIESQSDAAVAVFFSIFFGAILVIPAAILPFTELDPIYWGRKK